MSSSLFSSPSSFTAPQTHPSSCLPLHKLIQHTCSLFSRQALWRDAKEYVIKSSTTAKKKKKSHRKRQRLCFSELALSPTDHKEQNRGNTYFGPPLITHIKYRKKRETGRHSRNIALFFPSAFLFSAFSTSDTPVNTVNVKCVSRGKLS